MIRIRKSSNTPGVLAASGAMETEKLKTEFQRNPAQYSTRPGIAVKNIAKMSFDNAIYGSGKVKQQLIQDQHEKCCFCEAKFSDNGYGDVEHYRPKGAYKKRNAKSNTYPGYYWLAYDWNNLMYSCDKCNRKYKKTHFPLGDERTRKPHHLHKNQLSAEDRLLIDPLTEDPAQFITFKEEVPVPKNGSIKGKTSIALYGLERMNDTRMEYLQLLGGLLVFYEIDTADNNQVQLAMTCLNLTKKEVLEKVAQAKRFYNAAARDSGKFAYCVRCKFPHLPQN
jgi:uncharacterized protein (TIGR02646 family)